MTREEFEALKAHVKALNTYFMGGIELLEQRLKLTEDLLMDMTKAYDAYDDL